MSEKLSAKQYAEQLLYKPKYAADWCVAAITSRLPIR